MIRAFYERLRDSLFALPATIVVLLGAASYGARTLDRILPDSLPWLLPTTVGSTRAILSTVATATITVSGIVFSMTAVVVQLATSQLSPRVTQGFLRDPFQQVTVGTSVGTFVYALITLATVHGTDSLPFSGADFTATLAVVLGVTSMVFIVFFIDRTMRNMRIDTIIRRLSDAVQKSAEDLPRREAAVETVKSMPKGEPGSSVGVRKTGWVAALDLDRIMRSVPEGTLVRIDLRVGDFVTRREVAARTWPGVDEEAEHAIAASIIAARTRSVSTDPSYGIRQMVDIALRALSPALNDATTASDVVRHLAGPVQTLLLRDLPGRVIGDEGGRRIYLPRALTYSDYVHLAFQEIRLNSTDQPYVLKALIETIASLRAVVGEAEASGRTGALDIEAEETLEMVEKSDLPEHDRNSLLEFARQVGLTPVQ